MNHLLLNNAKTFLSRLKSKRYNDYHISLAKKSLRTIESIKGKTNPKLLQQADGYAREILGWSGYAPWLKAYAAMVGEFKEGWLPENYFGQVVVPLKQGEVGKTSFLRSLSNKLVGHKVCPDLVYCTNGGLFDRDFQRIDEENLKAYLFEKDRKVVFKPNHSFQGKGIKILTAKEFDDLDLNRLAEGVFQRYIQQQDFFNAIVPYSVATIRVLTVMDRLGQASIRSAYLRVGRQNDTHVQSNTQITIPIDMNSGALDAFGYQGMWRKKTTHPDSGFQFNQQVLPGFKAVCNLALELQQQMGLVQCIGWDMVVDCNDEVQLLEWNGFHTGIGFAEVTQGPCFKDLGWEQLWKQK